MNDNGSMNPAAGWPTPGRRYEDPPTADGMAALRAECLRLRNALDTIAHKNMTRTAMRQTAQEALYGKAGTITTVKLEDCK